MATYSQIKDDSVLLAKNRIACIANENYNTGLRGEPVDNCCIQNVLFTYGLLRDLECYTIDGTTNCWTEAQFLEAVQLLNSMLV